MPKFLDVPRWYTSGGTLVNGQEEVCLVIHSQNEFNNMTASSDWLGATNIIIDSSSALTINSPIVIPDTVKEINFASGAFAISPSNPTTISNTISGATTSNNTVIRNLVCSISGGSVTGSSNAINIFNNIGSIINATVSFYGAYSSLYSPAFNLFANIDRIERCNVTVYGIYSSQTSIFASCYNMTRCSIASSAALTVNSMSGIFVGYSGCYQLHGCSFRLNATGQFNTFRGFSTCSDLYECEITTNYSSSTTNTSGHYEGFYNCNKLYGCSSNYTTTGNYSYGYRDCDYCFGCQASVRNSYNATINTTVYGFYNGNHIVGCNAVASTTNTTRTAAYYGCSYLSACTGTGMTVFSECDKYDADSCT